VDAPEEGENTDAQLLPVGFRQPGGCQAAAATSEETTDGQHSRAVALPRDKGGARRGNRSAWRHGLRSNRSPADAAFIDVATDGLRRNVEDALIATKRSVSLSDAFVVNSIVRHESRAQKIAHYLRSADGLKLSIMERCQLLAQLSDATDRRDRAVRLLNLDSDSQLKPWLVQDASGQAAAPDDSEAAPNGQHATAGTLGGK
jgi:hypothetical protein